MKRFVLAMTLFATTMMGLQPAVAGDNDWYLQGGPSYPSQAYYPSPVQPVKQGNPLLQKLVIGGLLVGAGIVVGRLASQKAYPQRAYYGAPAYPVHHPHGHPSHGHHSFGHRGH